MCFCHLPDLADGPGPIHDEPSRYADEGESGSGADGGESVRVSVGRRGDGGDSGMFYSVDSSGAGWRASVALHETVVCGPPGSTAPEARELSSAACRRDLSIKATLYHAPYVQNPFSVVCTTPELEASSRSC